MVLQQSQGHHCLLQFILRGVMILWATFHDDYSKGFFLDISLENQNKNVMVALKGNCSLTCCWHQTKRQRVIKVFRIHPLGIVNM